MDFIGAKPMKRWVGKVLGWESGQSDAGLTLSK
jgi:hypothetical protein